MVRTLFACAALAASALACAQPTSLPGATQSVTVGVPAALGGDPFDRARSLNVPPGFAIDVVARIPRARFMAQAANGDLLVSTPHDGSITLLRPQGTQPALRFVFASGLTTPHDIVFTTIGKQQYVYVAESNRIARAPYQAGQTSVANWQAVVENLPDKSTPELRGSYGHQLKNIAIQGAKLYVSIASTCNACAEDTVSDPIRSAIYEYDLDGKNRRLFAQGIRNAEGLRFRPGTNELWAVVNNRDNIQYPFHKDWDGDGKDDYGRVMQSYVDGHPPDLLIKVRDGGNYGWPFCNSTPDEGLDKMPFDRDVQLNADGSKADCAKMDRVTRGLTPHSAPLGMNFLADWTVPWRGALVTAQHGCWNCSAFIGHKVIAYGFNADGSLGPETDVVSGWVTDARAKQRWGRPVQVVSDGHGGMYITDDMAGAVYWLHPAK